MRDEKQEGARMSAAAARAAAAAAGVAGGGGGSDGVDVDSMGVRALKEYITTHGGSVVGWCRLTPV